VVYDTICDDNLKECIDAFLNLCSNTNALFDTIRAPTISTNYWVL